MPQFDFYPEIRFACRSCEANCCARMEIPVTEAEKKALLRLNIPDAPPAEQCFTAGSDGTWLLAKRPDGQCVFADGLRCRIHALHSLAAKPLGCRVFPLHIQQWRDGHVSAEYRFFCPGVAAGTGRKLGELTGSLGSLNRELAARRPADDAVYAKDHPLPLTKVRLIHAAFLAVLHDRKLDWPLRFYAAARILAFQSQPSMRQSLAQADEHFAAEAKMFLEKARAALEKESAAGALDLTGRLCFRNLICLYLREDDPKQKHGPGSRLRNAWRQFKVLRGGGSLNSLNPAAPASSGRQLLEAPAACRLSGEALDLFECFFFGKLDSMHFCGRQVHNFSYKTGLRHLLCAVPAALALAAGYAGMEKSRLITVEHMRRAVRRIDSTFAKSPAFELTVTQNWIKSLTRPDYYAGLLQATIPRLEENPEK